MRIKINYEFGNHEFHMWQQSTDGKDLPISLPQEIETDFAPRVSEDFMLTDLLTPDQESELSRYFAEKYPTDYNRYEPGFPVKITNVTTRKDQNGFYLELTLNLWVKYLSLEGLNPEYKAHNELVEDFHERQLTEKIRENLRPEIPFPSNY